MILAIDPGPERSGWVLCSDMIIVASGVDCNDAVLLYMQRFSPTDGTTLAVEMIASYGMAVGQEVFDTCVWVGRFKQEWHTPAAVRLVYRKDVKLHLCGDTRAKDGNIRQALIDLYPRTGGGKVPQIGVKAKPGPLFGVTTHAWAALGVAVTAMARL